MRDMTDQLAEIIPTAMTGRLVRTVGTAAAVTGFRAPLGATVEIERNGRSTGRCRSDRFSRRPYAGGAAR